MIDEVQATRFDALRVLRERLDATVLLAMPPFPKVDGTETGSCRLLLEGDAPPAMEGTECRLAVEAGQRSILRVQDIPGASSLVVHATLAAAAVVDERLQ